METSPSLFFPPFRLDVGDEQLWRGAQAIELRPKTFAVLRYLVEHPGRLVTKEEVLNAVWPQTVVSEWLLRFGSGSAIVPPYLRRARWFLWPVNMDNTVHTILPGSAFIRPSVSPVYIYADESVSSAVRQNFFSTAPPTLSHPDGSSRARTREHKEF
jgi:hypothetical protein